LITGEGTVACAPRAPVSPEGAEWASIPSIVDAIRVVEIETYRCAFRRSADPVCWDVSGGTTPVPTPALKGAVDLQGPTFGDGSANPPPALRGCLLRRDGTVACVGDARRDDGVEALTSLAGGVSLASDLTTTCVARASGEVWCLGSRGSLGVSFHGTVDHAEPVPVAGLEGVVDLRAGDTHTCALTKGGRVACWGLVPGSGVDKPRPAPIFIDAVGEVAAIGASRKSDCAARRDGSVVCWGESPGGLRGLLGGDPGGYYRESKPVRGVRDVAQFSLGDEACGVQRGGRVVCWSEPRTRPTTHTLPWVNDARDVEVIDSSVCVVRRSGRVTCQMGIEGAPRDVPELGETARLTSNGWALRRNGTVAAFQVGLRDDPVVVTPVSGVSDAHYLASSSSHACVVRADGHVACWGANDAGQLGDGTYEARRTPVSVIGLDDAVEVACTDRSTCALRKGGRVVCWGSAYGGLLGTGEVVRDYVTEAVRVPLP